MSALIAFARGLTRHPAGLPEFPYAWLEAPLAARLVRRQEVPDWNDLHAWPSGRLFGEDGEYRWQSRDRRTIHAVVVLESGGAMPDGFAPPVEIEPVGEADQDLVLWGEWVDGQRDPEGNPDGGPRFYAREIPEIQTLPLEIVARPADGAAPRLAVRRYRDVERRRGEFVRCVRVFLSAGREEAEDE